jgi:hypothetical protein
MREETRFVMATILIEIIALECTQGKAWDQANAPV